MTITIINDCWDENAKARQVCRVGLLFGITPHFVGVSSDIEAAGNLIDTLDAIGEGEAIILVNVAPRHGEGKKWTNGCPFGFFRYKNTLVVSTLGGVTLSLVKKLGIVSEISEVSVLELADYAKEKRLLTSEESERIVHTQFRSFEWLPRIAYWVSNGESIPVAVRHIADDVPDIAPCVWFVDNFGNVKTTMLAEEISVEKEVKTGIGNFLFYKYLALVPDKEKAIIAGSSGIGGKRFCEIVVQGESAADWFQLKVGDLV